MRWRGDIRDRAGVEPFLKDLAEVDSASHTLSIGMRAKYLNHQEHEGHDVIGRRP